MEISDTFISFFPELTKINAEKVRERIYRHIAKKSEVYYSTANESLELSITSLLAEDIRSCASLLYYSLHKFINGSMYSYLNKNLELEDYKIEIDEVEHFTSANFVVFSTSKKNRKTDIDAKSYREKLCIKKNSADPFILMQYILKDEEEELDRYIYPYTKYISSNLFNKQYDDPDFSMYLNGLVAEFFEKRKKEKVGQEEEVKAAIAYAIEKSLKDSENRIVWMLYALSLRLYWLRQTADYEFDFEVKTSVREMSILLSAVKAFLAIQLKNENKEQSENQDSDFARKIKNKENLGEQEKDFEEENEKIIEGIGEINKRYSVDISFPSEIKVSHEVDIFLTAVHLDPFFKKEEIILVLNLTEFITNAEKYFIFDSKSLVTPALYVYINDDGRWTAWFKVEPGAKFSTISDLNETFNDFLSVLKAGYEKVFNYGFAGRLIYSLPIYIHNQEGLHNINSMINLDKFLEEKKEIILAGFTQKIGNLLNTEYSKRTIRIKDLIVEFRIIFHSQSLKDIVPFEDMFMNKVVSEPDKKTVINLIVGNNEDEQSSELIEYAETACLMLEKNFNMNDSQIETYSLNVSQNELEEFLERYQKKEYDLLNEILVCLNDVAYNRAMDGKIKGTYEIIDKYSEFSVMTPYALATRALLYLRDESLGLDESEEKGKEEYEKAMEVENENKEEYIKHLEQKYNYEMARFYLKRKINYTKADEHLQKAIQLGEECKYYSDSIELQKEMLEASTIKESATIV
ncbi:hypothetical protein COF74_08400 [Bacillus wiedmannii]|nr:hypothetical protein COF74_08400 [Bacillus wiedmannii]PHF91552.1 hypothetical protein COI45_22765 [Bacillus wiedmannii]